MDLLASYVACSNPSVSSTFSVHACRRTTCASTADGKEEVDDAIMRYDTQNVRRAARSLRRPFARLKLSVEGFSATRVASASDSLRLQGPSRPGYRRRYADYEPLLKFPIRSYVRRDVSHVAGSPRRLHACRKCRPTRQAPAYSRPLSSEGSSDGGASETQCRDQAASTFQAQVRR